MKTLRFLFAAQFVTLCCAFAGAAEKSDLICYMGVGGSGVAHVLGFIRPDGSAERYPEFKPPGQKSWVFGPLFSDGRRMILSSYEESDVKRVRSGKVVTHDWLYNLATGDLQPTLLKGRPADQMRPYLLLRGEQRILQSAIIGSEERFFLKDLDGGNAVELTRAGGGFHYAPEISHDGTRIACHVTGGMPAFYNKGMYSINVLDLASGKRTLVDGRPEHLCFGPHWSPDDQWLVYLDCQAAKDTAHFRAALVIGRADGTEHREITPGQTHWFGTPFGSNMSEWSPDGRFVAYTRLQENSKADMSAGGSQLCLLDPFTKDVRGLTKAEEGVWDFRAAWSPDGRRIAFTRERTGKPRELWIMEADGANPQRLTDGYEHRGADFARWLQVRLP